MSLEAQDVSFRYPCGRELYRGLSLAVGPGERVALTAPSGRGKTTLCRLLAGYLAPSVGRVLADGEPVRSGAFGVREEWLARRPHELSGGELMRLAMVRALSVRPHYLIADESTAMLDAVTQAELWHVLLGLQESDGWGLVLVSHSPALVGRVATRRVEL